MVPLLASRSLNHVFPLLPSDCRTSNHITNPYRASRTIRNMAQASRSQLSEVEEDKLINQIVTQGTPQEASELLGHVSHDKLCDTISEKVLHINGDREEDLFSLPATGGQTKQQPK